MKTVNNWIKFVKQEREFKILLEESYGKGYQFIQNKSNAILNLLKLHNDHFGNENVIIIRAPGRINLMGRHIDHQGGAVNLIAIDQEIFLTASLRNDNKIMAYNEELERFPSCVIDFSDLRSDNEKTWSDLIYDKEFLDRWRSSKGNWENYIKAAYLKLIYLFGKNRVRGINVCLSGSILIAAGLSSSTALTIGVFEALNFLNNLGLKDKEIIKYSAQAEKFVGTRGGSADHVAIKCSKLQQIAHVKMFDPKIEGWVNFPDDYELLIINTAILADKSGSKQDVFNERILSYHVGLLLMKNLLTDFKENIKLLRDIDKENLNITDMDIYKLLLQIPEYIDYNELGSVFGINWKEIKAQYLFAIYPDKIPIRKIIAYGLSEIERSALFFDLLKANKVNLAGRLMNISHDGDRIVLFDKMGNEQGFNNELNNSTLNDIIEKNYKIFQISGGYGCSIPQIDYIVDVVKDNVEVQGAQLSGAGLGGCVMVLVDKHCSDNLSMTLKSKYERKFNHAIQIYKCHPVNGLRIFY